MSKPRFKIPTKAAIRELARDRYGRDGEIGN